MTTFGFASSISFGLLLVTLLQVQDGALGFSLTLTPAINKGVRSASASGSLSTTQQFSGSRFQHKSLNQSTIKSQFTSSSTLFASSNSEEGAGAGEGKSEGYIPPEAFQTKSKTNIPYPKIGDLVRFYDLDGGRKDGQELVGKLTYIQPRGSDWLAEVTELDNVGDGYYAEYPSRKRRKSKLYNLGEVSPCIGSYVRSEDAFKIPTDPMGNVRPMFEAYDLEGYEGPAAVPVNKDIVQEDLAKYGALKGQLLKDALIAGLIGTVIAQFVGGFSTALVYFAGAIAGVGYLFFLSVKTDTLGSVEAKLGSNVANLRFALPLLVLLGVAFQNIASGGTEVSMENVFNSVTKEQFGAAMLGFLTYRLPLFGSQLAPLVGESAGLVLPGSAGIALQMAKDAKQSSTSGKSSKNIFGKDLTTLFVISGPSGTGKTELCKKLVEDSEGKLVEPKLLDKIADPIVFEQLQARDELLQVDSSGRYSLTKDSIFNTAGKFMGEDGEEMDQVLVIDADVELTKKLTALGGIRLVGVWVGLDELGKFESRLDAQIEAGKIPIPVGETAESVRRSKIRGIVSDIEFGVVSGIFEFTVLNDNFDDSLKQLKNAAQYCFE